MVNIYQQYLRIIFSRMNLWEVVWEGVNWIHLAQDTDQWRELGNMVVNFCVP
jgi:hypothetical protein